LGGAHSPTPLQELCQTIPKKKVMKIQKLAAYDEQIGIYKNAHKVTDQK
jgi:hypothetical protein